jgi:hypothetical protein
MLYYYKELQVICISLKDKRTAGFTCDGIFDSNSAVSALSLATNSTIRPSLEMSAFACISALAIIFLATESNFFGTKYLSCQLEQIIKNQDVIFCAALIFRNCLILSTNSYSVCILSLNNHTVLI